MAPNSPTKKATPTDDEVGRISVKMPPFWEKNPEVWFIQVEAQFAISRVSAEDTKFNHLLAQLDPKYLEHILDIISGESETKFTDAKKRFLDVFKTSEETKLHRLMTELELGDMQPSHLLRRMRALAGEDISDKALRTLWLSKMPEAIKGILVVCEGDLDKQASMADKITQISPTTEVYAARTATASPSKQPPASQAEDTVPDRIAKLERRIAEMPFWKGRQKQRHYHKQDRKGRTDGNHNQDGYCFYHAKFGQRARKCQQPCKWQKQGNFKQQQN